MAWPKPRGTEDGEDAEGTPRDTPTDGAPSAWEAAGPSAQWQARWPPRTLAGRPAEVVALLALAGVMGVVGVAATVYDHLLGPDAQVHVLAGVYMTSAPPAIVVTLWAVAFAALYLMSSVGLFNGTRGGWMLYLLIDVAVLGAATFRAVTGDPFLFVYLPFALVVLVLLLAPRVMRHAGWLRHKPDDEDGHEDETHGGHGAEGRGRWQRQGDEAPHGEGRRSTASPR